MLGTHKERCAGLTDAKISKFPLDAGYQKNDDHGEPLSDNRDYQKVIGQLLYLAVNTKPDISAAVSPTDRFKASDTLSKRNTRTVYDSAATRTLKDSDRIRRCGLCGVFQ